MDATRFPAHFSSAPEHVEAAVLAAFAGARTIMALQDKDGSNTSSSNGSSNGSTGTTTISEWVPAAAAAGGTPDDATLTDQLFSSSLWGSNRGGSSSSSSSRGSRVVSDKASLVTAAAAAAAAVADDANPFGADDDDGGGEDGAGDLDSYDDPDDGDGAGESRGPYGNDANDGRGGRGGSGVVDAGGTTRSAISRSSSISLGGTDGPAALASSKVVATSIWEKMRQARDKALAGALVLFTKAPAPPLLPSPPPNSYRPSPLFVTAR